MFKYTDEELIEKIKLKAKELGRNPKQKEVGHITAIKNRFGSWNRALELAGLNVTIHRGSEKYFINILKKWHKEHGRVPTKQDFKNDPLLPHPSSIVRKLKMDWYEIFFRYDIDRNVKVIPANLTDKELFNKFYESCGATDSLCHECARAIETDSQIDEDNVDNSLAYHVQCIREQLED